MTVSFAMAEAVESFRSLRIMYTTRAHTRLMIVNGNSRINPLDVDTLYDM